MAKILIADDDAASSEVISVALSAEGHEILYAGDGQEALDLAIHQQPDLIFLDVMMPVFNGYETCSMLRANPDLPPGVPIIFLTSVDFDKRKIEEVGATDFLPKQHRIDELRDMVVKYLNKI